jgi:hypothetical protein
MSTKSQFRSEGLLAACSGSGRSLRMEGAEEGNGLAAADMVSLYSLCLRVKARRKYQIESIHFTDKTFVGRKIAAWK